MSAHMDINNTGVMAIAPLIKAPMYATWQAMNHEMRSECSYFQEQFFRCAAAYGGPMYRRYCDLEFRDIRECIKKEKHDLRRQEIRKERMEQYLNGKRDKPFEPRPFVPRNADYSDFYKYNATER